MILHIVSNKDWHEFIMNKKMALPKDSSISCCTPKQLDDVIANKFSRFGHLHVMEIDEKALVDVRWHQGKPRIHADIPVYAVVGLQTITPLASV